MKKINILKTITTLSLAMSFVFSSISFATPYTSSREQFEIFKKSYTKAPNPAKADPKLYPLSGKLEYGVITKELMDYEVSQGFGYMGVTKDGYAYNTNKKPSDMARAYEHRVGTTLLPDREIDDFHYGDDPREILLDLAGVYDGELSEKDKQIREVVSTYLKSYDWENASEMERAVKASEFILSKAHYDEIVQDLFSDKYKYDDLSQKEKQQVCDSHYLEGVFLNGKAVCGSFAQAYQLLARATGLNCIQAEDAIHEWNLVEIDGKWYRVDNGNIYSSVNKGLWEIDIEEDRQFRKKTWELK